MLCTGKVLSWHKIDKSVKFAPLVLNNDMSSTRPLIVTDRIFSENDNEADFLWKRMLSILFTLYSLKCMVRSRLLDSLGLD